MSDTTMTATPAPNSNLSLVQKLNEQAAERAEAQAAETSATPAPTPTDDTPANKGGSKPPQLSRWERLMEKSHIVDRYIGEFADKPYACHACGRVANPEDSEVVKGVRRSTLLAEEPIFVREPHPTRGEKTLNGSEIELMGGVVVPTDGEGNPKAGAPTTAKDGTPLTPTPLVDGVYPIIVCQSCFGVGRALAERRWSARLAHWEGLQKAVKGIDLTIERRIVDGNGARIVPLREVICLLIQVLNGRSHAAEMAEERKRGKARGGDDFLNSIAGGLFLSKRERKEGQAMQRKVQAEMASEKASGGTPKTGSRVANLFPILGGKAESGTGDSATTDTAPAGESTTRVTLAAEPAPAPPPVSIEEKLAAARTARIEKIARRVEKAVEAGASHAVTSALLREKGPVTGGVEEAQSDGSTRILKLVTSEAEEAGYLKKGACTDLRGGTSLEIASAVYDAEYPALASPAASATTNENGAPTAALETASA